MQAGQPTNQNKNKTGPLISHARENLKTSNHNCVKEHEAFHSGAQTKPSGKAAILRELLDARGLLNRGFAVVLVPDILARSGAVCRKADTNALERATVDPGRAMKARIRAGSRRSERLRASA